MKRPDVEPVTLEFPGVRTQEVNRVTDAEVADSKRYWKIDKQENALSGQLVGLEESTRLRNREFEQKLHNIEERTRRLEAAIATELQEREEAHEVLMKVLKEKLVNTVADIEVWVEEDIVKKYDPSMAMQETRMQAAEDKAHEFITVTVPDIIEKQSGEVTQSIQKAHETFDIENAKIAKREQKILRRFETHVGRSAQSFEDEKASRLSKLWLLSEDIEETERMDDRAEENVQIDCVLSIKAARESMRQTTMEREKQDCLLLDSMLEAQEKLQACIIDSFGMNVAAMGGGGGSSSGSIDQYYGGGGGGGHGYSPNGSSYGSYNDGGGGGGGRGARRSISQQRK